MSISHVFFFLVLFPSVNFGLREEGLIQLQLLTLRLVTLAPLLRFYRYLLCASTGLTNAPLSVDSHDVHARFHSTLSLVDFLFFSF